MVGSMLPHEFGVVSDEPTVLHPAGQSEVQVHPDVVIQGAVICRGVGAEQAIPVHVTFPSNDLAFVRSRDYCSFPPFLGGSLAD